VGDRKVANGRIKPMLKFHGTTAKGHEGSFLIEQQIFNKELKNNRKEMGRLLKNLLDSLPVADS
jgi:hypothetical protein